MGMLAADERVKKALIPLSLRHLMSRGYGFFLVIMYARRGLNTKAFTNIQPTSSNTSFP